MRGDFFYRKSVLRRDAPQGAFFVPIYEARLRRHRSAMMSAEQHSSTAARMRMAQLRKNASGRIRITGSVAGSKSQLSLPGKKMLWNTVKARSKSRAARTPAMASAPPRPQPAQKPGL